MAGKSKVDDEVLDNLEEVLITSDVGVETTLNIIKRIETRVAKDKYVNTQELNNILREEIAALLMENNTVDAADFDVPQDKTPYVIMVVGVNGVGKRRPSVNWLISLKSREKGLSGCCRYFPCRSCRAVGHLGRTCRCAGDKTENGS